MCTDKLMRHAQVEARGFILASSLLNKAVLVRACDPILLCRGWRHTVVRLFVSHYAEGGATKVYCNRAVCPSFTSISRRSLKTKR